MRTGKIPDVLVRIGRFSLRFFHETRIIICVMGDFLVGTGFLSEKVTKDRENQQKCVFNSFYGFNEYL